MVPFIGARLSRRRFVQGVAGLGLALLAGCDGRSSARRPAAKAPAVHRIGYLSGGSSATVATPFTTIDQLRTGLRDLGYIEGTNITLALRYAEGDVPRLPELAAELVALPVEVLVAVGPATRAARAATSSIPIVQIAGGGDLIEAGLIESYAHPGGNVTGVTELATLLAPKRLALLKETLPALARVGVLRDPMSADAPISVQELHVTGQALNAQVLVLDVREPSDITAAVGTAAQERADALIVLWGGIVGVQRAQIVALAQSHRLPTMYDRRSPLTDGGLMAYGPDLPALYRRAAFHVDKILRGASPADLPVEQPTRFEFVINLKAARTLGLTIPPSVLAQATEVIQ